MNVKYFMSGLLILLVLIIGGCEPNEPEDIIIPGKEEEEEEKKGEKFEIESFSFLPIVNSQLSKSVKMTLNDHVFSGYTSEYIKDKNLIATFECKGEVVANGVVQTSGITKNDFTRPVIYTVNNTDGTKTEYTVDLANYTGLPVVHINTGNKQITSKDVWIAATMEIDGAGDFEDFELSPIEIKGRGNTTWGWSKKPYAIRLESRTSVLGMPKHKRWVLLANYMDRTLLRNRIALYMAQQTSLAWTPKSQYVEVFLNNKHIGNYLLAEQVRVDKNRINISEETGVLYELDFHFDNKWQWKSPKGWCVQMGQGIPFSVAYPDDDDLTSTQFNEAKNYINLVANALYGTNFKSETLGYRKYIDAQSFIDYWLIFELSVNHELANPGSIFMYKDDQTKLTAGPCWDYDWGTFSYKASPQAKGKLFMTEAIWYSQLFKDPYFKALAKERWNLLKDKILTAPEFLDAESQRIARSATENAKIWNPTNAGNETYNTNGDEQLTYSQAVARMRSILVERINDVGTQINKW